MGVRRDIPTYTDIPGGYRLQRNAFREMLVALPVYKSKQVGYRCGHIFHYHYY